MCRPFSAIVLQSPRDKGGFRLLMSPYTDSHSDLITLHDLKDAGRLTFARIEFTPPDWKTAHLVESYALRLDEERAPAWWTEETAEAVTEQMRAHVSRCIITDARPLLLGGKWIIGPGADVGRADFANIIALTGGTLNEMTGGTLLEVFDTYSPTICAGAYITTDHRSK